MTTISEILEKWVSAKEKISILEDKIEKYKKITQNEMRKKNANSILEGKYSVVKRNTTRTSLAKADVPSDIWNKYSRKVHFDTFIVKKVTH